jgi:hypothetical protein
MFAVPSAHEAAKVPGADLANLPNEILPTCLMQDLANALSRVQYFACERKEINKKLDKTNS